MTAACIGTGYRKLRFQWTAGKRSDDHPSWKEPGASTVSSIVLNSCQQHGHVFRHCYEVRTGMRREGIYMSVSGCGPNSEFPARLLPSWSVSGNCIDPAVMLRQMLAQVRVWAVAAYKYLKYLLWDITHTEKWPCPGVVQACMVVT